MADEELGENAVFVGNAIDEISEKVRQSLSNDLAEAYQEMLSGTNLWVGSTLLVPSDGGENRRYVLGGAEKKKDGFELTLFGIDANENLEKRNIFYGGDMKTEVDKLMNWK